MFEACFFLTNNISCYNGRNGKEGILIIEKMNIRNEKKEDMLKCPICEVYFNRNEGFACPRCKRGPLCKSHKVPGQKECAGCVLEMKFKEKSKLQEQEKNIKNFTRLLQFVFILFSIIYIAYKIQLLETIEFIENSIYTEYLIFVVIGTLSGYLIFYLLLRSQRNKIDELEAQMEKVEIKR